MEFITTESKELLKINYYFNSDSYILTVNDTLDVSFEKKLFFV